MDQKFKSEEHLRVISNTKDFQGIEVVNDVLRKQYIFTKYIRNRGTICRSKAI